MYKNCILIEHKSPRTKQKAETDIRDAHIYTPINILLLRGSILSCLVTTRDHLAWTIRNVDPMHEVCIPHGIPHAREQ